VNGAQLAGDLRPHLDGLKRFGGTDGRNGYRYRFALNPGRGDRNGPPAAASSATAALWAAGRAGVPATGPLGRNGRVSRPLRTGCEKESTNKKKGGVSMMT